uniref:NADH dehydrogenase subunit 6 n=1 Tax=Yunnanacris wenshanensis TaxID=1873328 RepID=A0A1B1LLU0_9ORTH|nr:NADH dehydrogenase subunit 6 [Yunnanacris wenshanensis]
MIKMMIMALSNVMNLNFSKLNKLVLVKRFMIISALLMGSVVKLEICKVMASRILLLINSESKIQSMLLVFIINIAVNIILPHFDLISACALGMELVFAAAARIAADKRACLNQYWGNCKSEKVSYRSTKFSLCSGYCQMAFTVKMTMKSVAHSGSLGGAKQTNKDKSGTGKNGT